MERILPEAMAAICWEQEKAGVTILADKSETSFNRGSEQGEARGAVKAVGPLAEARGRTHEKVGTKTTAGIQDEWYVDDGIVVCHPGLFHTWLATLDKELEAIGITRGRGSEAKSTAKLVCPKERMNEFDGWATPYVRETCKVLGLNAACEYLGTWAGGDSSEERMQEKGSPEVLWSLILRLMV